MILITGGSGSGKSAYGEKKRILEAGEMTRYYIATMEVFGEEGKKKWSGIKTSPGKRIYHH